MQNGQLYSIPVIRLSFLLNLMVKIVVYDYHPVVNTHIPPSLQLSDVLSLVRFACSFVGYRSEPMNIRILSIYPDIFSFFIYRLIL